MNAKDDFSIYYAELLEGIYACVDRIVLNAYFAMGQTGGGLRTGWRQWPGDGTQLDDEPLRALAGTFSRRLTADCPQHQVPLMEAQAGERKPELAEPYLPPDPK